MTEVGMPAALAAGLLALLSPCSALLLPSFFAYSFAGGTALLRRTALFYLGLLITLVPLGMGVGAASALFYGHRQLVVTIAGWTVIGLGVLQILGRSFATPFAGRVHQLGARLGATTASTWSSTVVLGAVYGLAGFCSGPVLGAILTMAATQDSPLEGGLLLAVYALGMAAPLFFLAALWDRFELGRRRFFRGTELRLGRVRVHSTSLVSGLVLVVIGVLFLRFDGTAGLTGVLGLGDTTDLEFAAQETVADWAAAVPPWVVPAAVTVLATLLAVRRATRSRANAEDELTDPAG
jgi:cytochrome c biogenesis protein CcdA